MEIVTINVGGIIFEITRGELNKFPDTRLGRLTKSDTEYSLERKQYFFSRSPEIFNFILDVYRTGNLHLPTHVCGAILRRELEFWEIPLHLLSECCDRTYSKFESKIEEGKTVKDLFERKKDDYTDDECSRSKITNIKRYIWRFLDQPASSLPAKVFSVLFMAVVLLSILTMVISTLPEYRVTVITDEMLSYMRNTSTMPEFLQWQDFTNPKIKQAYTTYPLPGLLDMEYFYAAFFSLEFILHFASSPNKKNFFCNILNSIDAFLSFTLWTILILINIDSGSIVYSNKIVGWIITVASSLSVLRMVRIFRLLQLYSGFGILCLAFKSRVKDTILLTFLFLTVSILFGFLIYLVEFPEPSTFPNAFTSIWWAVVTMTTVGYGDHYPKSFSGCIVATGCALSGLIFIAMPVALLASSFSGYLNLYQDRKRFISRSMAANRTQTTIHSSKPKLVSEASGYV